MVTIQEENAGHIFVRWNTAGDLLSASYNPSRVYWEVSYRNQVSLASLLCAVHYSPGIIVRRVSIKKVARRGAPVCPECKWVDLIRGHVFPQTCKPQWKDPVMPCQDSIGGTTRWCFVAVSMCVSFTKHTVLTTHSHSLTHSRGCSTSELFCESVTNRHGDLKDRQEGLSWLDFKLFKVWD